MNLLHLFNMGYDTQTIADNCGISESEAYNLLHAQREEARASAAMKEPERIDRLRDYNRKYQSGRRAANRAIREAHR